MRRRILASCLATIASAALVTAQGGPPQEPGRGPGPGMRGPGPGGAGIDIIGVEPIEFGEPVLGAPFSADAITEMVQDLPDGNRIERRSTSTIARDGSGRTRREQTLPPIGPVVVEPAPRIITISDPTQRVLYLLDPIRKIATKSSAPQAPPARRGPPPQGVPGRPPRPEIASARLGTREIAGVRVEGTRETMTIPAGAFGNLRPIDIVTERWYSPELKVVVESRRTDPRNGEVLYRLVNVVRVEPTADLFQVPSDYTVVERARPSFPPLPRQNEIP
jgi:hypothetical protein